MRYANFADFASKIDLKFIDCEINDELISPYTVRSLCLLILKIL